MNLQDYIAEHHEASPKCTTCLLIASNLVGNGVPPLPSTWNHLRLHFKKENLYCEFPRTGRGRRSGELNHSLPIGIYQTSIAIAGVQQMLTAMNKPVLNLSSLIQLNKVGTILWSLKEQDITDCLENGRYSCDMPISAECDRQYTNPLRNSRGKSSFSRSTLFSPLSFFLSSFFLFLPLLFTMPLRVIVTF